MTPFLSQRLQWRGDALWRYFFSLVLFFTVLQVGARLVVHLVFLRDDLNLAQALSAYFYGLRFDLRLSCIAAGIPLIAGALPGLGRWLHPLTGRWLGTAGSLAWFWPALGAMLLALWSLVVDGDVGNMAYWQQRLNVGVLFLLQDFKTNLGMVWDTYPVIWLSLLMLALAALGGWAVRRIALRAQAWNLRRRPPGVLQGPGHPLRSLLINTALVLVGLFLIHGRWSQYPLRWSDLVRLGHPPAEQLAINPVQNVVDTLAYRHPQFDRAATVAAYPRMAPWLRVSPADVQALSYARTLPARAQPLIPADANIVIVIMESLSGYKTSLHGNRLDPTPVLKTLADQGWWFSRFGSAHPFTARGVYSIVTSRPDVAAGDTASRNPQAILHKSLIATWQGHQPYYFIGGSTSWANVRGLLTKAIPGIKIFEEENFKTPRVDVWGLSDRNLFYESLEVLNQHASERRTPFFALIQTAANHRPYTIPPDDTDFRRSELSDAEAMKHGFGGGNAELNAVRLMDHSVGKFLERARQAPWFDNTVFVFLGDHGTQGDVPGYMPAWMQAREISIIHTPLILYAPKLLKPQHFDTLGQQADLLPTLVDMSGQRASNRSMGRSLIDERPEPAGLFFNFQVGGLQYGWFDGRYFAKVSDPRSGDRRAGKGGVAPPPVQLFDLSQVSGHQVDIAARQPELVRRLGEHLEAYFQTARYSVMNP